MLFGGEAPRGWEKELNKTTRHQYRGRVVSNLAAKCLVNESVAASARARPFGYECPRSEPARTGVWGAVSRHIAVG